MDIKKQDNQSRPSAPSDKKLEKVSNIISNLIGFLIVIMVLTIVAITLLTVINETIDLVMFLKDYYYGIRIASEIQKEATIEIKETAYNINFDSYKYTLLMPEGKEYTLRLKLKSMPKLDSRFINIRYTYTTNLNGDSFYSNIEILTN